MKHKLLTTLSALAVIAAVAIGATYVSAWTAPTATAPGGNVFAPVNTGPTQQAKDGTLLLTGPNGRLQATGSVVGNAGIFTTSASSILGRFGCLMIGTCTQTPTNIPLGVELNAGITNPTDALYLGGDTSAAHSAKPVSIVTNKAAVTFWQNMNNAFGGDRASINVKNADLSGTIKISGGNPSFGSILTSDEDGDATWSSVASAPAEAQPRIGLVIRSGGGGEITRSCPTELPILISASAGCTYGGDANPSALAIMRMDYMGAPGSPGNAKFRCVQNNMNVNSPSVADVRLVCASPELATVVNYGLGVQQTWHDVAIGPGNFGQSCQDWLNTAGTLIPYAGQPQQAISSFNVGVMGSTTGGGLASPAANQGCLYRKIDTIAQSDSVLGMTFMSGTVLSDIWGNNYARQPKTFSDPNWQPVASITNDISYLGTTSSGGGGSGTFSVLKTQIFY